MKLKKDDLTLKKEGDALLEYLSIYKQEILKDLPSICEVHEDTINRYFSMHMITIKKFIKKIEKVTEKKFYEIVIPYELQIKRYIDIIRNDILNYKKFEDLETLNLLVYELEQLLKNKNFKNDRYELNWIYLEALSLKTRIKSQLGNYVEVRKDTSVISDMTIKLLRYKNDNFDKDILYFTIIMTELSKAMYFVDKNTSLEIIKKIKTKHLNILKSYGFESEIYKKEYFHGIILGSYCDESDRDYKKNIHESRKKFETAFNCDVNSILKSHAINNIAISYRKIDNFKKAKYYYEEALKVSNDDYLMKMGIRNNISCLYLKDEKFGNLNDGFKHLEKAIEHMSKIDGRESDKFHVYDTYIRYCNLDNCFFNKKLIDEVLNFLLNHPSIHLNNTIVRDDFIEILISIMHRNNLIDSINRFISKLRKKIKQLGYLEVSKSIYCEIFFKVIDLILEKKGDGEI